jgi:hypothetical protein
MTVDVQGRLVRDPRTDATLVGRFYRDNPALCLADYMTSDAVRRRARRSAARVVRIDHDRGE